LELYLALLKAFLKRTNYTKYFNYFNLDFVEKNYPELGRVFKTLPNMYGSSNSEEFSVLDLSISFYKDFPKADVPQYDRIFGDIHAVVADDAIVEGYLEEARKREVCLRLAKTALQAADGMGGYDTLPSFVESLQEAPRASRINDRLVSQSLKELYEEQIAKPGLRWRLKSLNIALGSLRTGDFGFVFARPETGKTTFLASEVAFMAGQTERPIVWFNNEEQGGKVKTRCYQSVLGLTRDQLYKEIDKNEARFQESTANRIQIYDEANLSRSDVEACCRELRPGLIIFDQIDKIKGFAADRNDLELKELYGWAREIAKSYGPVIGVCQAGGTGENKQWLSMNDVDSSKTSKQGEADWILGIGKVHEPGKEYVRYMHLSKNKLQGDADTDGSLRHGQWSCFIRPEIAQYADFDIQGRVG
jgi:hypothetical protein